VCDGSKAALARSLGAGDVIDYTRDEIDHDGTRYDVIIDTAGNRSLSLLRRAMTPRGTLVLIGGSYKTAPLFGGFQRALRAPLVFKFKSQNLRNLTAKEGAAPLEDLTVLFDSGAVTPAVDRTYTLADAPAAMRHFADGHPAGKIVVTL
jgi:NADPH:quinone reductase-like Zn-dependent oxidoreductase